MKAKTLDALLDKWSRCPICNATMKQERDTVEGTLLEASDECTNCGRYYYQFAYGSHETYVGFFRHRFGWYHTDTISVIQEEYRLEKKAVKWERFKWKWWGRFLWRRGPATMRPRSMVTYLLRLPFLFNNLYQITRRNSNRRQALVSAYHSCQIGLRVHKKLLKRSEP